jgi:hypothetical protein
MLGNGSGGFSAQTTFAVGTGPYSVSVGDFNGDSRLDIATANADSGNVSVMLGNGSGGFSGQTTFVTGSYSRSIVLKDFNGDGRLDIATANTSGNSVSVMLGNGSGGFGAQTTFAVVSSPRSIGTGDFNGDGIPDLATANSSTNNVSVFLGNGSGGFSGATTYAAGTGTYAIGVEDFNGDGKSDLVAANRDSNNISVFLNTGSGSFGPATTYTVGTGPYFVSVGDVSGDGKMDLVTANQNSNNVSILLGDGSGSFSAQTTFAAGSQPKSVTVADLNGNGTADLMVGNRNSSIFTILNASTAGITVPASGTYIAGQTLTFTVRFDEAVNVTGTPVLPVTIGSTVRNATYVSGSGSQVLTFAYTVASGELDSNGITLGNTLNLNGGTITDLPGTNNAVLSLPAMDTAGIRVNGLPRLVNLISPQANGSYPVGAVIPITLNFSDTVTLTGSLDVTLNTGAVVSVPAFSGSSTTFNYTVAAGQNSADLDVTAIALSGGATLKDGSNNDISLSPLPTGSNSLAGSKALVIDGTIPVPQGLNAFSNPSAFAAGTSAMFTAVGDFNGDGKADLATANYTSGNVSVLLGNGSGGFSGQTTYATGAQSRSIAIKDFTGDGKLDLAVLNQGGSVSILAGDGNGSFSAQTSFAAGSIPRAMAAGDFNGDGKPDLVVASQASNQALVLLNNGSGSFSAPTGSTVGSIPYGVDVNDFNQDGRADLVVANLTSNNISVLLGLGSGGFSAQTTYATGVFAIAPKTGDFNGDNQADIAVVNYTSNTVSVMLGNGSGGFSAQTTYATLTKPRALEVSDFNSDGKLDLAVANQGDNKVSLFLGDGNGNFASQITLAASSGFVSIAAGDFNSDSRPDLAMATQGSTTAVMLNTPIPVITLPANGTYIAGQTLTFTVRFSEPVTVTGTPVLPFTLGSNTVNATYLSTSGNTLTFRYTVVPGDLDSDGITVASALSLSGGTIRDAAGNNAVLTLPTVNTAGIIVNAPALAGISSISSTQADNSYGAGTAIPITLNFSQAVTLAGGNLDVTLNTGAVLSIAPFSGTSATATYTVVAGQNSSDLDVTAIALSGGATFQDTVNSNTVVLTLPSGASSLAGSKAIAIDTTTPSISSITSTTPNGTYGTGSPVNITVNFSEPVTLAGGNLVLTLDNGVTVNLTAINNSNSASGTYTVVAGQSSTDLDVTAIALSGGATLKDAAGNDAAIANPTGGNSLAGSKAIVINTTAPSISSITSTTANGTYGIGSTVDVTVNFSEPVTLAGGNLVLTLDNGATVNLTSIANSATASGTYTVNAGQNSSDLNVTAIALAGSATLKNGGGNDANLTVPPGVNSLAGSKAIVIDGTAPGISSITSTTANGTYGVGSNVNITVNFSEPVNLVGGNLVLTLDNSATVNLTAINNSNSASGTYTVAAGQNSADLNVTAIALAGGVTLKDGAGNDATLTAPTGGNSLAGGKAIVINTNAAPFSAAETKDGLEKALGTLQTVWDSRMLQFSLPVVGQLDSNAVPKFLNTLANQLGLAIGTTGSFTVDAMETILRNALPTATVTKTVNGSESFFDIDFSQQTNVTKVASDLGLSALGLRVDNGLGQGSLNSNLKLTFGSNAQGFFIDTAKTKLTSDLNFGVGNTFNASGKMGLFKVNLTDDATQPTRTTANFTAQLNDVNASGGVDTGNRLTAAEITSNLNRPALTSHTLKSDPNIGLRINSNMGSAAIPGINTTLRGDIGEITYQNGAVVGTPTSNFLFNNTELNAGSLVNGVLVPVLKRVDQVMAPVRPILDMLYTDLKSLGIGFLFLDLDKDGKVTPMDIVTATNPTASKFVNAFRQVSELSRTATQNSSANIQLGSFSLPGFNPLIPASSIRNNTITPTGSTNVNQQLTNGDGAFRFLDRFKKLEGVKFPLLDDPTNAIRMLVGQPADLFTYDLPELTASVGIEKKVNLGTTPFVIGIGGDLQLSADLAFGFDTFGLQKWSDSNYEASRSGQVFEGFYISDRENPDGTGPDVSEFRASLGLTLSGGVGIALSPAVDVFGGLVGELRGGPGFDLKDPNSDGKVRADELTGSFPLTFSDVTIKAGIGAEVSGGIGGSKTIRKSPDGRSTTSYTGGLSAVLFQTTFFETDLFKYDARTQSIELVGLPAKDLIKLVNEALTKIKRSGLDLAIKAGTLAFKAVEKAAGVIFDAGKKVTNAIVGEVKAVASVANKAVNAVSTAYNDGKKLDQKFKKDPKSLLKASPKELASFGAFKVLSVLPKPFTSIKVNASKAASQAKSVAKTVAAAPVKAATNVVKSAGNAVKSGFKKLFNEEISDALVFLDTNFNNILDGDEPFALTLEDGSVAITIDMEKFDLNKNDEIDANEGQTVALGGYSPYTGLLNDLTFVAPAGSFGVTPITTLISQLMKGGKDEIEAMALVNQSLGFPADLDAGSFIPELALLGGDAALGAKYEATLGQIHTAIVQMSKLLDGASTLSSATLNQTIIQVIAEQMAAGTPLNLAQPQDIQRLLTQAIAAVQAADPSAKTQPLTAAVAQIAQVIAESNQRIATAASGNPAEVLRQVGFVLRVTLGDVVKDLEAFGAGKKTIQQLLQETTGAGFNKLLKAAKDALTNGDDRGNVLRGSSKTDILRGKGGNDEIFGDAGSDRLFGDTDDDNLEGDNGNDILDGGNGNDALDGGKGKDRILGGDGNDILAGGNNKDILLGGQGRDRFEISLSDSSFDRLPDFSSRDDVLVVSGLAGIKGLKLGKSIRTPFIKFGKKAGDRNDYFVYRQSSGSLSYDADGSGKGKPFKIAQLMPGTELRPSDILVS